MRLLANENIPRAVVEALRTEGHDVLWALESSPGATDTAILRRARAERRVLLTNDKDFGELARASDLPKTSGVILLRMHDLKPDPLSQRVVAALNARSDWAGHFSVVEPDRVRMTRLGG